MNPIYEKNSSVLLITVTALNVTLWKRLYLRTDAREELKLPGYEELRLLKEENHSRRERLKEVKGYICNIGGKELIIIAHGAYYYISELEALQAKGRKYASNWS